MNKITGRTRIVYLIGQLGLGGSERQLYLLLKYMDPEMFEPHVVVFNPSPHLVLNDALEAIGVKVYSVPENCRGILPRTWFLYRLLRKIAPDIIHSWVIHDNPYAGLIGFLSGIPIRMGSMRDSLSNAGFQCLPWIFQFLSLYSTERLMVNAQSIAGELEKKKYPLNRVVILNNCVEFSDAKLITNSDTLSFIATQNGHRLIGTVGNLRRKKNHRMFIDGLYNVLSEFPDICGLIIGQSIPDESDYSEQLDNRIKTLGLTGKVMLAGFRDDVPALMHHLYVFCLLSDYEGTPNVILEAMAAARPVVATRVGGIPDLVQDNVTGFLVEAGDVDGFANAVKRLLDDPALADRMGLAGQEIARRNYSCQAITRQLEQIYMQALEVRQ